MSSNKVVLEAGAGVVGLQRGGSVGGQVSLPYPPCPVSSQTTLPHPKCSRK